MVKSPRLWMLLGWAAVFATGCLMGGKRFPRKPIYDFVITDPALEQLFWEAVQEWLDVGLLAAAKITVNANPKGLPVKWCPPSQIMEKCGLEDMELIPGTYIGACGVQNGEKFTTMWVTQLGEESRERLKLNIMHEIIHILLPTDEHLKPDIVGILNLRANSKVVTRGDLEFLKARTEVVDVTEG